LPRTPTSITDSLIAQVAFRVAANKPVRRTLPEGGRIHIDRQLPFLVVYRPPPDRPDPGMDRFVKGEASYLIAPKHRKHQRKVAALVEALSAELVTVFGSFLLMELWSGPDEDGGLSDAGEAQRPQFRVVVARRDAESESVTRLVSSLGGTRVHGRSGEVDLVPGGRMSPPDLPRLSRSLGTATSPVRVVGIEIRPVFRDRECGDIFPVIARSLHRQLSRAIQRSAYEFAVHQTTHQPRHYQSLGRRAIVKAVTDVDRQLAKVAAAFDLLLLVTPVNTTGAYRRFVRRKASSPPLFRYRPLDIDPVDLKRALYRVPIERVEDPTLAAIFRQKQRELSLELDLLSDRQTPRFLHTGAALFGEIEPSMLAEAALLLDALPSSGATGARRTMDSEAFAAAAQREVDRYRMVDPTIGATVEIRDDITSLMVSRGRLLVGSEVRIPANRAEALIQHEVGTHIVTYWNGAAQRLRLLATGLAGHDELQEGLAVLAEYLVAGLTPARLRVLAARVVAAQSVVGGAEFIDTYRLLVDGHGFSRRVAFQIATRVHRGGGLIKDAVYLRGLQRVVSYLAEGGRLDTLLVGKIAVNHVAVIEELQRRGVLTPPPLRPAYLDHPDTHYRLERLKGLSDLRSLTQ
jgi:uncharacterized protein (TIGR02421 family)